MFKIITFNANGIRAAARKGFFEWLKNENADAVCIQETKAQLTQLHDQPQFFPFAYNYYHDALKKGYSGVALYLKKQPLEVKYGIGWQQIDDEGRYLEARYQELVIISLYLHSGTSGAARQQKKEEFMADFLPYLQRRSQAGERIILCGDLNIAHTVKDIKNWRNNRNNSGFLPQERQWLSDVLASGYCDAFRHLNQEDEQYTWWSQRGRARQNNVGWRIDYQIISNNLVENLTDTYIYRAENFSDHAPLVVCYRDL